jgi:zinc protease
MKEHPLPMTHAPSRPIHRLAALVVALLVLLGAPLAAQAFEIRKVTSPGGIAAWLVEDHTIPLIAMEYSFAGGSAGDSADRQGLATFLSGMLDEGAGDIDSAAFQRRIEDLAVKLSFDANRDDFTGSLQTLSENRAAAFDLLRLALTQPRFDAEPLERMRSQFVLGINDDAEDPEQIASQAWMHTVFGNHPYGRPSKGDVAGIKAVTSADLRALTARLFARDGLMVAVVGDIDAAALSGELDKVFGALPDKSGMPEVQPVTPILGPIVQIIERDIPQSVIRFGSQGIARDDPDFIPAYVMNFILGDGGFGSRLTEQVREKRGLAYSIYTALYPLDHAALFYGATATVNEQAGQTLAILRAELKRMAEDGPTEQELAEAKTYLTGSYALRFDSNRKIAGQLLAIQREKLGIDYITRRNSLIQAVSLDDVRRMARRIIDSDALVVTIVGKPKDLKPVGKPG